jgi:hypothetical protein
VSSQLLAAAVLQQRKIPQYPLDRKLYGHPGQGKKKKKIKSLAPSGN